jgi:hypothetical protein
MATLRSLLTAHLFSDAAIRRAVSIACFAACPLFLFFAIRAITRHAATPGELVIGLLAGIAASQMFIVIGLLLSPIDKRESESQIAQRSP